MIDVSKIRRKLLIGMFLLALGALLLHFNLHSPLHPAPGQTVPNTAAFILVLSDVVAVTWLFSKKKTAAWGYLFNGLIVIYGTVIMTHFGWSFNNGPGSSILGYMYHSTTPEIIIAWADFCLGAVLYRLWFIESPAKS